MKYCVAPFTTIETHSDGSDSLCCPAHNNHPKLSGNTIVERFNSPEAQAVRQTIQDGTYKYCKDTCPFLVSYKQTGKSNDFFRDKEILDTIVNNTYPIHVVSAEDRTCNLACPSCRKDFVLTHENDRDIEKEIKEVSQTLVRFTTSGSGDPFYNKKTFNLLKNMKLKDYTNLKTVEISTNGILLNEENYNAIKHLPLDLYISIDAAYEETYNIVRRGGAWNVLMRNLEFLNNSDLKSITLSCCIQRQNQDEIVQFFGLMERIFTKTETDYYFFLIENWHMTDEEYKQCLPSDVALKKIRESLSEQIMSGKITTNI